MTGVIDISLLQFGQLSIVGTTQNTPGWCSLHFLSPDRMSGRAKGSPWIGARQSEKQELDLARSLCDSGSITKIIVRLLSTTVEGKRNRLRR